MSGPDTTEAVRDPPVTHLPLSAPVGVSFRALQFRQDIGEGLDRFEDLFADLGQFHGTVSLRSVEKLCPEVSLKAVDLLDRIVRVQTDAVCC